MAIIVKTQDAIKKGQDFVLNLGLSLDDNESGKYLVSITVGGDPRDFGMKRGSTVLAKARTQRIRIAGPAMWLIQDLDLEPDDSSYTVSVVEITPGERKAKDDGSVL
jgi:hypothetical protein